MAIQINTEDAAAQLARSVAIASSDSLLPQEWIELSQTVFDMTAKTYATAFGTALLAKATDSKVDPLSIKATGDRNYSLRTLGHSVLVPGARIHGFSIRATGREPLNNQPFFRYSHMSEIDRVRNPSQFQHFINGLSRADVLTSDQALLALAAFVRVATAVAEDRGSVQVSEGDISAPAIVRAVGDFLKVGSMERPKRLQAIAAAALSLGHVDVRSRKLNDPSRDYPGDVQIYNNDVAFLAMEVRGKAVSPTELESFIESCAEKGIRKIMLLVDWPKHAAIQTELLSTPLLEDVSLSVYESTELLVKDSLLWADLPIEVATAFFASEVIDRLKEIEVGKETLEGWVVGLDSAKRAS